MPQKQSRPVDGLPMICAAGKNSEISEAVGSILKEYSEENFAEILIKDKEKHNYSSKLLPEPPIIPESNQLRDVIYPDSNKSRFLEFKDQFYENLYCKKFPLGKPTPTNSKPHEVTNENFIFGKASKKSERVYDIALPHRKYSDVLKEFVKGHDVYKLSHGNYFPSEQIDRRYSVSFKRNQVFGKRTNVNSSGEQVKNILQNFQTSSKMNIISKSQRDYIEERTAEIGKPMRRQKEIPELIFGDANLRNQFNVKKLLNSTLTPEEIKANSNLTTYRSFCDNLRNDPVDCTTQAAGTLKSKYPQKGLCSFLAENLGEETTVKQLISPSVPVQFGLSHRDFLLPRSKSQIRRIFTNCGFDLGNDEIFEKIWALALSEWTSIGDRVSVEAFKYALYEINNPSS